MLKFIEKAEFYHIISYMPEEPNGVGGRLCGLPDELWQVEIGKHLAPHARLQLLYTCRKARALMQEQVRVDGMDKLRQLRMLLMEARYELAHVRSNLILYDLEQIMLTYHPFDR